MKETTLKTYYLRGIIQILSLNLKIVLFKILSIKAVIRTALCQWNPVVSGALIIFDVFLTGWVLFHSVFQHSISVTGKIKIC